MFAKRNKYQRFISLRCMQLSSVQGTTEMGIRPLSGLLTDTRDLSDKCHSLGTSVSASY